MDLVRLVTVGNLIAKPLDLPPVGDIGDVRRDAQPLRQSRRLAEMRFRQAGRRDVAHCDIAGFRHKLADQLAPHFAASTGDYRDPARELLHVCSSLGYRARAVRTRILRRGIRPAAEPLLDGLRDATHR